MSYAIDIILAKAAINATREQLKRITDRIKEKNPTHEWVSKNEELIDDLIRAYQLIMVMDLEMIEMRGNNFNQYKLIMEHEREIERLKKENKELREML